MAKQTGIEFDGVEEMRAAIDNLAGIFPDKVVKAVHLEGEYVMTDSKRNYVPVDLGVLRSSGFVNPPVRSGKEVSVTIGFGGAASAYALAVHEHPSTHSPPSWQGKSVADILSVSNRTPWSVDSGRGPKYLERPLRKAVAGMPQRIAQVLQL